MIIQNNSKNIYPNSYNSRQEVNVHKNINFSGPRLSHQSFEEFEKFAEKTDFINQNLSQIFKPENFVAAGGYNAVYKIPNNDVFLIRISKKSKLENFNKKPLEIKAADDDFAEFNFGQKIATIDKNISIIIKQTQDPHGINDWHKCYEQNIFPKELVPEFIEKLKKVSELPQKAYTNFAKEIRVIEKNHYFFDYFSPRNVFIDKEQESINIIDITSRKDKSKIQNLLSFTSANAILFSLLDAKNLTKAYQLSNEAQKIELREFAKNVKNKSKIASKEASLKPHNFLLKLKFKFCDIRRKTNLYKENQEFNRFLNDL